jgi:AraC-like DNA-binding protein
MTPTAKGKPSAVGSQPSAERGAETADSPAPQPRTSPIAHRTFPPSLDTILYDSPVLRIGKFRVSPEDPRFSDSGPTQAHIFVFPRTLVRIRHEGASAFLAGPDVVTYYNRGQAYRRESVEGRPDRCEWFAFDPAVLGEAVAAHEPEAAERPDRPFACSHGPGDPAAYAMQRRVVDALSRGGDPDALSLSIEETMLGVLDRILAGRTRRMGGAGADPVAADGLAERRERELAEAAQVELGRTPGERRPLAAIAAALGVSVFHLCRVFRRRTGTTLHAYRNRLRLAASLELLGSPRRDLTDVALRLGFSSHSHFTSAFRRHFGVTPSAFRGRHAV